MSKSAIRNLAGFTSCDWNKFDIVMRDSMLRLLYFVDTVRDGDNEKLNKTRCGACFKTGHRSTNRKKCIRWTEQFSNGTFVKAEVVSGKRENLEAIS